jgi:hypothetical protein
LEKQWQKLLINNSNFLEEPVTFVAGFFLPINA